MSHGETLLSKVFVATLAIIPFYLPLSVWAASNFGSVYIFSAWKELVMAGLLLSLMIPIFGILKDQSKSIRLMAWSMLAYIVLSLAYIFWANSLFEFTAGILFSTRFLLFFLIAYVMASKGWLSLEKLQRLIIATGIVLSLVAILQVFVLPVNTLQHLGYEAIGIETPGFPPAVTTLGGESNGLIRPQATLRGPNALGAFLVLPFALLFWKFLRNHKLTFRNIWPLVVVGVGMLLTLSRSAWIATAVACLGIILTTYQNKIKRTPSKFIYLGTIIAIIIGFFALNNQTFKLIAFREDPVTTARKSDSIRTTLNKNAWHDVVTHPLGQGPGSAGPVSVLAKTDTGRIAENYFLQVAQETGWLGLVLFGAINVFLAKRLWELRKNSYALVALVALVGLSITSLTLHTWADDSVSIIWWSFAGCVVGTPILSHGRRKIS